jgi:hypothetical protein
MPRSTAGREGPGPIGRGGDDAASADAVRGVFAGGIAQIKVRAAGDFRGDAQAIALTGEKKAGLCLRRFNASAMLATG